MKDDLFQSIKYLSSSQLLDKYLVSDVFFILAFRVFRGLPDIIL